MNAQYQNDPQDPVGLGSGFQAWWAEVPDPGPYIREGLIVLDANVLLHLYRVTPTAREQILATLLEVRDRLWIPHQAALEFHRNRVDVVLNRLSQFREVRRVLKDATNKAAGELRKAVLRFTHLRQMNMTDRVWDPGANGLNEESILSRLDGVMDSALAELVTLEAEHDLAPNDLQSGDPVLARLDEVTRGRIGPPYLHAELRHLVEEATSYRYPNLIPPGYRDAERKPTPYRAAGDYILWRQIMDYAQTEARGRMLVMVTSDAKEDWWELDKNGKAQQGRPELRQELFDHSKSSMVQMMLSDFLEAAVEQFPGRVSPDTVSEVRESERTAQAAGVLDVLSSLKDDHKPDLMALSPAEFEHLIRQLLEAMGFTAYVTEPAHDAGFDIDATKSDANLGVIRTVAQVKRYSRAVSLDAVHALYGVMTHVKAQAGIMVTTSWFGSATRKFVEGKPLTLIDGPELISLLHDYLDIDATISIRRPMNRDNQ
ncbi:hypothetical protein HD597_008889 [Nonomuraea thailandensis]|uniref:Restriction endonuclease n=1 Tax=Nonomuraea thailandensis TaxID=1188745 RepID=A0A9X2K6W4_9ACTN|nr:PIN-like domain-containing protein [Nonomuraea thailandensis]MCP2361869.1 hypothetical protein [Nonomuraea thailandensis]